MSVTTVTDNFVRDLRSAARGLARNPLFALVAVVTLAIGIGANTAVFSVVNAVLLKPVPFAEPDSLVQLVNATAGRPTNQTNVSPAKFAHWRALDDVFNDVAAYIDTSLNYTRGDVPERVATEQVSEAYFRVFRAPIVQGRGFTREEDQPGAARTVIVSEQFWSQRLGGDPGVIGTALTLSGTDYTIVGVVGDAFDLSEFGRPDLWVPLQLELNTPDLANYFRVAARLKPGVAFGQARERVAASLGTFRERFPTGLRETEEFTALTLQEAVVGPGVGNTLWVLLGAVTFVLLIACANVANLLLIRAAGRRREIGIRFALGAGRTRIVRQLLVESLLLSTVGGCIGLALGYIGMRALLTVNTAGLPRLGDAGSLLGLDWHVVGFTVIVSLATGTLFGLFPALVGSRTDLNSVLKDSSSRSGGGLRQNRTRSVLVAVEVALAVVLLIGAALLIRTSIALRHVEPGFNAANVLTLKTSFSEPRFAVTADVARTVRDAFERIRAVPGVTSVAATCCVPLQGSANLPFNVVGRVNDQGPFTGATEFVIGTDGYFESFSIPVLRGRVLTERDDGTAPPVVVVNQAFAKQFWAGGADPLNDRILIGGGIMAALADEPARQIVGIVGDVRGDHLGEEPKPTVYVPQAQMPDAFNAFFVERTPMVWVVRTAGDPLSVSPPVQAALRKAVGMPVTDVQSMEQVVALSTSRERFNMLLMSVFGGAALLLATIGIYGLMAYAAQQRTQELGVRLALGAAPHQVKGMVLRQGATLIAIGVGVGLVAAFYLANLLAAFLFGVKPHDGAVFAGVPVVLGVVALAAVWSVADRAGRIDPLVALRHE